MKRALLNRRHASLDLEQLQRYRDLFSGGEDFRRRISRYLIKNDLEPQAIYDRRCESAHYLNYSGPIGGYFASLLFSKELLLGIDGETETPPAYVDFLKSVDGKGQTFASFLRSRFVEALQTQCAYWRVDFPRSVDAATLAATTAYEYEQASMGEAVLTPIPRESLINWSCDGDGWKWVLHYCVESELEDIESEQLTITEHWTAYYRDGRVRRWESRRLADQSISDDDEISEVAAPPNPTQQIPIVELSLNDDLWLMAHLADGQLEHFRKRVALSWAIDRTCYAMPIFNLKGKKHPPKMGAGYYLMLGIDETVTYAAPPADSFAVIADYTATLKDELHRVSTTMARGVDNNAAAIGRSGESKDADDRATEVVLDAYGARVKDPAAKTLQLMSRARGELLKWTAAGMSGYKLPPAKDTAEAAATLSTLNIPSATAKIKIYMRAIRAMNPDLTEEEARQIEEELEAAVTQEDVIAERDMATEAQQQALEGAATDNASTGAANE